LGIDALTPLLNDLGIDPSGKTVGDTLQALRSALDA
jgi:hypothetical protein